METVDQIRDLIRVCRQRLDTDDPTGQLKPSDATKYRALLIRADEVWAIMESRHWSLADYEHLETLLRGHTVTMLGIAWDIEGCHPRDWTAA